VSQFYLSTESTKFNSDSARNRHCHLANFYELFIGLQRALNLALKMAVSGYTQGGETGIGKMAAEKVWVPPAGRGARGGILNKPRRQMSFLSSSDSCELAPLRVCELASILCDVLCVSFWVMPRMLGKFPESFRLD
jgi:hypothetical protein